MKETTKLTHHQRFALVTMLMHRRSEAAKAVELLGENSYSGDCVRDCDELIAILDDCTAVVTVEKNVQEVQ